MQVKILQNGKHGAALFLILMIISSLSVFGGILMLLGFNRILSAQLETDRVKAVFLAEAGIAQAIYEIKSKNDADKDGLGTIKQKMIGDGYFTVIHNVKTSEIRSTGVVNGVRRTIQIKYAIN